MGFFLRKSNKTKKMLNVGCGSSYHTDWINLDINTPFEDVIDCDITKGFPIESGSVNVVYSSHVLEHLKPNQLENVMKEIKRVLKPNGILRLAVPNLEEIAIRYLQALQDVRKNNTPENNANYDWMMLELYDQTVRTYGGGKMGEYLRQKEILNKEFIVERIGFEAENYWKNTTPNFVEIDHSNDSIENEIIFRNSGEIHYWMYDSYSLRRLMSMYGFNNIKQCKANESNIRDFGKYNLEIIDGKERKPDSLYMEGIRGI